MKLENNIYSVSQSYPGVSLVGSVLADNRSNHRPAIIWSDEGMRLMDCLPLIEFLHFDIDATLGEGCN